MSTKGVTRAEAKKFGLIDHDWQICLSKLPPPNAVLTRKRNRWPL